MASADEYAQWIVNNADKKGTPEFATVAAAYREAKNEAPAAAAPEPPQRTLPQELGRQAGLGVRYGVEGLASLPGIFIDPFQQAAGGRTMSQATSSLLDRMGVPKPETDAEQLAGAISKAAASGGGSIAAAKAIPAALNASPALLSNIFTKQPLLQGAQAGIGAGASELTRQSGGSPFEQLIAGALTPLGATSAASIATTAGRGGRELVRPLTAPGAKQVAADVVGGIASDKTRAAQNIDDFLAMQQRGQVGVPGSKPTAGAVSADYGLIGGEQMAARGPANPDFAARLAANNEARLADLSKLRATDDQVARYAARREQVTTPLRESAFANAKGPVDYTPVAEKIVDLAKTPEGGRENSRKALEWLADRVKLYADDGRVAPQHADALRMDIGDLVAGKISNEQGSIRLAAGLANDVKKTLAGEINKVAPGFQRYLETYTRLSKPIDRLEAITTRLGGEGLSKVTNATPMVGPGGPQFGLSQAKMRQQVGNIENDLPVGPRGLPLAPAQRDILGRVMGDLNSEALALRGGKMPGSDTYQNMATANLLSSIFGKTLADAGVPKAVSGPLNFAYKPLEQRIRNLVDEAYLDPKKMAELLKLARTQRGSLTINDLITNANQNIYGGLLGGAATSP